MLYNLLEKKNYMYTAGKITIATALSGLLIFAFIFLFNAGKSEIMRVEAQSATTTLTVLNTPPSWVASSTELVESSVSNPTNSGDVVSWVAVATDPNQANYYLLICSTSATPSSTNNGAPRCNGGTQWGVSAPTAKNTQAIVSTTTTEVAPFATSSAWFAWICDDDATFARCNSTYTNGTNATNSSPFIVNFRPTFTSFYNNTPANPGALVTFYSTSTDSDLNTVQLVVCRAATYSTTTNNCGTDTIATTSPLVASNATAAYTLASILRDQNYNAFGYLIDQFGHEAIGATQGSNAQMIVNNVAPTVTDSSIIVNGGLNITPDVPAGQKTGLTLSFTTNDANSCRTSADALEIVNFGLALYQYPLKSTSTCDAFAGGTYDANSCYTSAVATTTWNLSCTASTTSCDLGGLDPSMTWSCTFPVWYVMNPTDSNSYYLNDVWKAAVAGIDDDNATGTLTVSVASTTVNSFTSIDLLTASIPYGQLEPGQNSGTLNASTTAKSTGNTGLNQSLQGESMCGTYTVSTECPNSATSTIPETQQQFGTSSVAYGSGLPLSSSTPQLLQIGIKKSTSTITASAGNTYWGIGVPGTITLAGSYTGLNTFYAVTAASSTWY
jgi:hypothetical protein